MPTLKEILLGASTDGIVAVGLVISLILSIIFNQTELAMNIGTGLIGFIGGKRLTSSESLKSVLGGTPR